jgi:hypothetical protein
MQKSLSSLRAGRRSTPQPKVTPTGPSRAALNEHELAARWGMSVKTLRRWRQEQLGPVFCKLGARVIYLITEVEAFERRCSRYATGVPVSV